MIKIRKSNDRGHASHGWLDTYHTFSFSNYFDEKHMGFRALRVINEDFVNPKEGFDTHGHQDMEIISYVLEGALKHKDSMGNGSVILPGEVQYMSAGTGVRHSEHNGSDDQRVHLLQIWILPDKKGYKPAYDQRDFKSEFAPGKLALVVSSDGSEGSIKIRQDIRLCVGQLDSKNSIRHRLPNNRFAWVQVTKGNLTLNGMELNQGDGAEISETTDLEFKSSKTAEFLFFDLN